MLILNTALGIENLSNKSLSLILNHLKIEELDTLKNLLINNNIFTLLTSYQKDIKHIGEKELKSLKALRLPFFCQVKITFCIYI